MVQSLVPAVISPTSSLVEPGGVEMRWIVHGSVVGFPSGYTDDNLICCLYDNEVSCAGGN